MSVWRELRCDANVSDECWDRKNGGPGGFETESQLRSQARKSGWIRNNGEDICFACRLHQSLAA